MTKRKTIASVSAIISVLLACFIVFGLAACERVRLPEEPIIGEDGLVSVVVFKQPSKTHYYIGETFDPSGMVLKANYEDGSTANLLYENCTYKTEPLDVSDTEIVITFGSKSASVDISVTAEPTGAEITGITLATPPNKTKYVRGELFSPVGMVVRAVYSDSTTFEIHYSELEYPTTPLTVDDTSVTVRYGQFTLDVDVVVSKYSISIESADNYVYRMEAEATDLSTITLTGWAAGKDIVEQSSKASGNAYLANLSAAEGYAEYGVYSAVEGKVTLYITCALGAEGGTMDMDNAFTATWNGNAFVTGAQLVGTKWDDFQSIKLGCVPLKKGDNTLRLTRKGTCPNFDCVDFDVNNPDDEIAVVLESIELTKQPDKTAYIQGEVFDPTGMIIKGHYSDGSFEEIPLNELTIPTTPLTDADTKITVEYMGNSVEVDITVVNPVLSGIELVTPPRTDYVTGETFNPVGMVIRATYENAGTRDIPVSELTYPTEPLTDDITEITVSYGVFDVKIAISVSKYSLKIESDEHNVYRMEAEAADLSNIQITASWAAGKSLIESGATASGGKLLANLSATTGYVEYGVYSSVACKVSLYIYCAYGNAGSLQIDNGFDATWNGQKYVTGAEITGTTWTDFQKIFLGCVMLKQGDNILRLTHKGNATCPNFDCVDFDVNNPDDVYEPIITEMELIDNPTKTAYYVGEAFDPAGMKVRVTYFDETTAELTPDALEYSTAPFAASGNINVTVRYKTFSVQVPVTVTVPAVESIELITPPNRVSYVKGEVFNPEGIVIRATYENSTSADVPLSELTYSTEPLAETDTEVQVGYGGFTVKITISVSKYSLKIESGEHKTYRLEAENADLSTFTINGDYKIVEDNENASGGKQLCNLWAVSGYVDYGVYSEIEGKASIYIYVSTGVDNVKADTAFTMTWNGVVFVTGADIPNKKWETIQKIYLGCVTLRKGENVLRLTKKGTCPNFDCVDFEVNAPSAVLDSEVDVKLSDDVSKRTVEAEALAIAGTPANGAGKVFVTSGGTAVENLGTAGNTVTIDIYSQSAKTISIGMIACQAYGTPLDFASVFTVTLNGNVVTLDAAIPSNANWSTYVETTLGTLELSAGKNTLVFTIKATGKAPNIDKFTFTVVSEENA